MQTSALTAAIPATEHATVLPWILRTGLAMCFIGHGSLGINHQAGWVPYFAVTGIDQATALSLMPWVGAMDIIVGILAFVWPSRALMAWAAVWAVWTALLRPFAGQGWSEFVERAGNYGVPIAILVAVGLSGPWFARIPEAWSGLERATRSRLMLTLRVVTAALLLGHAGCALLLDKAALAQHYAVFGITNPANAMSVVGWFELVLAAVVLFTRSPWVILGVVAWKLASESLVLTSGISAPFFCFVEHGGSYAAPLALAWMLYRRPEITRSMVARTA